MVKTKISKKTIIITCGFMAASIATITGMMLFNHSSYIRLNASGGADSDADGQDGANGKSGKNRNGANGSGDGDGSEDGDGSKDGDDSGDGSNSKDKNGSKDGKQGDGGSSGDGSDGGSNGKSGDGTGGSGGDGSGGSGGSGGGPGGSGGDVITSRDVESYEAIPFGTETANEVNLPRGQVKVAREGVEGSRKIVTRLTYRNGGLIGSEVIYSGVVREPANQMNLVGISDYNLNSSYIQFYPNASVSRNGSNAPAFMILVNGNYYVDFWYDPVVWNRIAPAAAVLVSGGSFSYSGETYKYNTGPLDSSYPLTEAFCAEYGLACGRW